MKDYLVLATKQEELEKIIADTSIYVQQQFKHPIVRIRTEQSYETLREKYPEYVITEEKNDLSKQ